MQKTTQGHIHAHLQRAADLLSFGGIIHTTPIIIGDKLKLQTVDRMNKPMTLWIQIDDFQFNHDESWDITVLGYEGPDIQNYATQDIAMRGRGARLWHKGYKKTNPLQIAWRHKSKVQYDDMKLLYRPFIEVPYTDPPRDGEKMYKYDNSGVGNKRKR